MICDYKDPRAFGKPVIRDTRVQRVVVVALFILALLAIYSLAGHDDYLLSVPTAAERAAVAQIDSHDMAVTQLTGRAR